MSAESLEALSRSMQGMFEPWLTVSEATLIKKQILSTLLDPSALSPSRLCIASVIISSIILREDHMTGTHYRFQGFQLLVWCDFGACSKGSHVRLPCFAVHVKCAMGVAITSP